MEDYELSQDFFLILRMYLEKKEIVPQREESFDGKKFNVYPIGKCDVVLHEKIEEPRVKIVAKRNALRGLITELINFSKELKELEPNL